MTINYELMVYHLLARLSSAQLHREIADADKWIGIYTGWLEVVKDTDAEAGTLENMAYQTKLKELAMDTLPEDDDEADDLLDEQKSAYSRMIGESLRRFSPTD